MLCAYGGECASNENPRQQNCRKCGRPILTVVPDSPTRRRNLDFERQFTEQAAKGVADATVLIDHSEVRAAALSAKYVNDPMLILGGRDRKRDVREELSDARNHICFDAEELQAAGDDEGAHIEMQALRHVILAYNLLLDLD